MEKYFKQHYEQHRKATWQDASDKTRNCYDTQGWHSAAPLLALQGAGSKKKLTCLAQQQMSYNPAEN